MISSLLDINFTEFQNLLNDLFSDMWAPLVGIVASVAVLWGIFVGLKFWKAAGDENKLKEAKSSLISFIIGIVIIFVIAAALPALVAAFQAWVQDSTM